MTFTLFVIGSWKCLGRRLAVGAGRAGTLAGEVYIVSHTPCGYYEILGLKTPIIDAIWCPRHCAKSRRLIRYSPPAVQRDL
jgi:hypothetical protein